MNVICTSSGVSELDEVKCEEKHPEVCNTFVVSAKCPDVKLSSVINCEKFSKLNKLLHVLPMSFDLLGTVEIQPSEKSENNLMSRRYGQL